ncbi:MAG: hypothetical protein LBP27_05755, partial [Treponema sp.]|nr:hypothetical protein [Treponema sp.]
MLYDNTPKQQYELTSAVAQTFTVTFGYIDAAHVKAMLGTPSGDYFLVRGSDYTVSPANPNGGTLTRVSDWASLFPGANLLTVYRETPITQEVDLVQNARLDANLVEDMDDKLTAIAQESRLKIDREKEDFQLKIDAEAAARAAADALLREKIEAVQGRGGYLIAHDFGTGDLSGVPGQQALTAYALEQTGLTDPNEIWNGTHVKNLHDGTVWALNNIPDAETPVFRWVDDGPETIGVLTNNRFGAAKGVEDPGDGSRDGEITATPQGTLKLIGFRHMANHVVGEYADLSFEPTPFELAQWRYLPLKYQIVEIALYEALCARKYVGDALNDTADWWYKCDANGARNANGLYMRVEDDRGLFRRGAGANAVKNMANNDPYNGEATGKYIPDAVVRMQGSFQA